MAEGQCFRLGIIGAVLRALGDPDASFIEDLAGGVTLGVDVPMPRAPLIFEKKTRWSLEEPPEEDERDRDNYKSIMGFESQVEKLFREEAAAGWMEEVTDEEARRRYSERLCKGSLGVVDEKTKIRVVHDGSHGVHVNHKIKTRDQVRMPGAGELETLLGEMKADNRRAAAVIGDAQKAHRRVKVREEDWGYMACRLVPRKVWLNKVGTYGFASAGYFWSRLAAAVLVRMVYYLTGRRWSPEVLLYADDWIILAGRESELADVATIILVLEALGVPMKWAKYRGGFEVCWVGYEIGLRDWTLGISEARARWLIDWMMKTVEAKAVDLADLTAVLGRLAFAMGPLDSLRPFLAPIYAWTSAAGSRGVVLLPWSMLFLFKMLAESREWSLFRGGARGYRLGGSFQGRRKG